jgi:hypothetical protein
VEIIRRKYERLQSYPLSLRERILRADEQNRNETPNIWYQDTNHSGGNPGDAGCVHVSWIERPTRLENLPLLILDAHIDAESLAQIFPDREIEYHDIRVKRRARIVQVSDTPMSKAKLRNNNGSLRWRLGARAAILEQTLGSGLVVGPKGFIEQFQAPKGVSAGHFNHLRGKNEWEHCKWVMVIGRNQPPPAAMENVARALYADSGERLELPGNYDKSAVDIQTAEGQPHPVSVHMHPDPRINRILWHHREAEIEQAIDRIRSVRAEKPKHIFVVTHVPLRDLVDELITLEEFLGERRLVMGLFKGNGVLPLGKKALAEAPFSDLWESEAAAERWVEHSGLRKPNPPLTALAGWGVDAHIVRYRVPGQRGRDSKAVTALPDLEATREQLQVLLGQEVLRCEFEVGDG